MLQHRPWHATTTCADQPSSRPRRSKIEGCSAPATMASAAIDDALAHVRSLIEDVEGALKPEERAPKAAKPSGSKQNGKPSSQAGESDDESALLFAKAKLVVARVAKADDHPEADRLLCLQLDVGAEATVPVVAGLKGHVEPAAFIGQHVVAITNLKPCKLAGRVSEAMILAASCERQGMPGNRCVRVLQAPAGAKPGARVRCRGKDAQNKVEAPKTLSSKIWAAIVSRLVVQESTALYDGCVLETEEGVIKVPGVDDNSEIH
mmetsp:Transcript_10081/g.61280  ORF Transcript_10081/g.61280 Transcript_10081/m.61280 type:complete len:263 (-) Transcript_10081:1512-2300(-)